jgi:hypothetical protein
MWFIIGGVGRLAMLGIVRRSHSSKAVQDTTFCCSFDLGAGS